MSEYGSDEDEDLKRAIALSLGQTYSPASQEPIDLTGDDDDEPKDTEKKSHATADASQKVEAVSNLSGTTEAPRQSVRNQSSPKELGGVRVGLLAFDRKKMEEERLARIRKRKASTSSPPNTTGETHQPKALKISHASTDTSWASHPEKEGIKTSATQKSIRDSGVISYTQQQAALQKTGIQYPKGTVKKTWAYGYPRENDIKIEEVLQKHDLDLAVLSAFQWDDDWLAGKLNLSKTKLICVVQTEDEAQRDFMRTNSPPSIRYIFPSMEGQVNCMHAKFLLLSHPTYLRIAIPSANLVAYDWGESGGTMENIVFLIDLPRLPDGKTISSNEITSFGKELLYFLEAMGMDQPILKSLLKFDFTETKDLAFIHTIGGNHSADALKRTGYCGLGAAIRELGLSTSDLELDYVTASVGSLNNDFLTTLFLAAQGVDEMTAYNLRNDRPRRKNQIKTDHEQKTIDKMHSSFRIYFPTRQTVKDSKGGAEGAGTICLQPAWWDNENFPRSLFRDCHSLRNGMLMHNKMLFARPKRTSSPSRFAAWTYVGSSNLSSSAWGTLVRDSKTKLPKLNCRNWECGVVVPVPSTHAVAGTEQRDLGMEVFNGTVPVPMEYPGAEYGSKRPWFFREG